MTSSNSIAAYFFSLGSIAIPALLGIALFHRLQKSLKLIAILMVAGLLTELCLITAALYGKTNHLIINIYGITEVLILTLFFSHIIVNQSVIRVIKLVGAGLAFTFVAEIVLVGPNEWNSFSTVAEGLLIICIGLCFFYEFACGITPKDMHQNPDFWITAVLMFYFMSSIEYFLLNRYLQTHSFESLKMMGQIHTIVNAFCNLAYAVILWIFTRSYSFVR